MFAVTILMKVCKALFSFKLSIMQLLTTKISILLELLSVMGSDLFPTMG